MAKITPKKPEIPSKTIRSITDLSIAIVKGKAEISNLNEKLKKLKATLERQELDLGQILSENQIGDGIHVAGCLLPKVKEQVKIYIKAGVSPQKINEWLRDQGLLNVTPNHQSMNSQVKQWEALGNEIPKNLFNVQERTSVTILNGPKYLRQLEQEKITNER